MKTAKTTRRCIGFGETEGRCGKPFVVVRGAYWCPQCDQARIDMISRQLGTLIQMGEEEKRRRRAEL